MKPSIVVLDFGSQYTQLIARSIRQLGVYCEIHPYSISFNDLRALEPSGIILSGGPASVTSKTAPKVIKKFLDMNVPVLGICYGMQLLSFLGKGAVNQGATREYGFAQVEVLKPEGLFLGFSFFLMVSAVMLIALLVRLGVESRCSEVGLLSAVGPFTIDMYLPAMPEIGRDLAADVASVQLTITVYFRDLEGGSESVYTLQTLLHRP